MSRVLDDLPRDPDRLLHHLRQMAEVVAQQDASLISLQAERDTVLAEQNAVRAERDAVQAEIEERCWAIPILMPLAWRRAWSGDGR
jgi:glutamine synthetase type III